MKGGQKEGTLKQQVRKVHFVALMDIRHILKYKYIPKSVRKSNLKCGNSQAHMKEAVHEHREEMDEAGIRAENLNLYNH